LALEEDRPPFVDDCCLFVFVDLSADFVAVVFFVVVGSQKDQMIEFDLGKVSSDSAVAVTCVFNSQDDQVTLALVQKVLG
jgi:hypothetical protein